MLHYAVTLWNKFSLRFKLDDIGNNGSMTVLMRESTRSGNNRLHSDENEDLLH